jgi:hypothetical protein
MMFFVCLSNLAFSKFRFKVGSIDLMIPTITVTIKISGVMSLIAYLHHQIASNPKHQ